MKVFRCHHCHNLVFFENIRCERCRKTLAYLPDCGVVASLEPAGGLFTSLLRRTERRPYRLCLNNSEDLGCNWAVVASDADPHCRSCRLTRAYPTHDQLGPRAGWARIEAAKRRLIYSLDALGLPLEGLAFEFLPDPDDPSAPRFLTGHANGVISINVAEADDAERERRRISLGEPYRTLLGHLRHETGHFYFDQLVKANGPLLDAFRQLFGDDRQDYGEALRKHYTDGPPPDWSRRHVTAYAAAHPWEDWAETWAHYLHMVDALETAAANGLSVMPPRSGEPTIEEVPDPVNEQVPFDRILAGWHPLTYVMNNLNRGFGLADAYPFVLSMPAVDKLRFVHEVIAHPMRTPKG